MLITKTVNIRWNSKIKNHYVNLGYKFTKMKNEFEVFVCDLTDSSFSEVTLKCDYCGKEYIKPWYRYIRETKDSFIKKDCCAECRKYKLQETSQVKYGVNSVFSLPEIKEKISHTNIEKYGTENPFASNEIKDKIANINLEKYGVKSPIKLKSVQNKVKKTCQEKYGVDYFIQTQVFSGSDNPRWKGGVKYHRQERSTNEYINWRKSVYCRDLYTCQKCGAKSKKGNNKKVELNAHHIFNWKDYPDKRYDVNNGITLCVDCHNEFHSIYGRKDNTQKQIKDYIGS